MFLPECKGLSQGPRSPLETTVLRAWAWHPGQTWVGFAVPREPAITWLGLMAEENPRSEQGVWAA